MKLSFVILGYKDLHYVRLCIKNILKLNLSVKYEIIYVDNAGHVGIPEMVRLLYPKVRIVQNEKNLGHPAGNNAGLRVAQGEYILMINPDIVLRSAEDIQRVLTYMDEHKDIAILGPRLNNTDGTVQNSCYRKYSKLTPIFRRTFLGKLPWGKKDIARHLMLDFDHDKTQNVEWILGACLFLRKSIIDQIGLMNPKFFMYFGDYEWCDRAWASGYRVVYFHDVHGIFHYHKRESASSRFSIPQLFSYATRVHLKDWLTYLHI
ncbi:MAG: glycosyltransferase family 2 protein [Candidatus Kerfeldbacteria bacterium]|nr:glycosyltransferase family 2 protein [Candidatus Kerfeldbacteria bacterium]